MEVVSYSFGDIPLLSLAGEFDHDSVPSFTKEAEKALGSGGRRLLLQLTDCPYIDSGGIGCLLDSLRKVGDRGWVGVVGPSPDVLRLLKIVGLTIDPNFRVFSGLDEVQAFLRGPASI